MPDGKSSGAGTLSRGHDDRATFGKIRPAVVGQDFQKKMFDGNRRGRSRVCRRVCSERRGALGRARGLDASSLQVMFYTELRGISLLGGCAYRRLAAPENRAVK